MGTNTTTSYLDPPQLIGRPNADGTISLTPLELKRLNDYNYYVAKMIQGGLNLANLNKETNQTFTDIEGNVATLEITAEGLTTSVSNLAGDVSTISATVDGLSIADETGSYTIIDGDKLESYESFTGNTVRIETGEITSATATKNILIKAGGIYMGGTAADKSVIYYEPAASRLYMSCDDAIKLLAGTNVSIDSSGTIYIGTSAGQSGNVSIGQVGGTVNLVGAVNVNGVPI